MPAAGPGRRGRSGARYRTAREQCFAKYGHLCHLCGHDGAEEVDHLSTFRDNPNQPIDPDGMRPAHGGGTRRCPECGEACNQVRGTGSVESARHRIQSGNTGFKPSRKW